MLKKIITSFLLIFLMQGFPIALAKGSSKINIIVRKNGVGLSRDAAILKEELEKIGHRVKSHSLEPTKGVFVQKADINIFLEHINKDYFPRAAKNYFIPNPEWLLESDRELVPEMDLILCKTRECERIFKELHPNTSFLGFTSLDRYDSKIEKCYRLAFHLGGKSAQKGTDAVFESWLDNPNLPPLLIIKSKGKKDYLLPYSIIFINKHIKDKQLVYAQNQCGLHICPSETEGFGHYLMEALSTGAVLVTTDAPPMNEFVTDQRCLAGYLNTTIQRAATNYYVDPTSLAEVVCNLMLLPEKELQQIGRKNREFYLENKHFFEERMKEIFKIDDL